MENSSQFLEAASWIGRQQAFAIIANRCSAAQALCLKQAKESGAHQHLGLTWEDFCSQHAGIPRSTADRIIQQYEEFGEAYFKLSSLARISPDTYREIAGAVDAETIEISGVPVALSRENAPKIRAHLQSLRAQLRAEKQRTEPGLQELRTRLDNLLADTSRRVDTTLPPVQVSALRDIALDATRLWRKIANDLDRLMGPIGEKEPAVKNP